MFLDVKGSVRLGFVAPRVGGKRISTLAGGNGAAGVLVGRAERGTDPGGSECAFLISRRVGPGRRRAPLGSEWRFPGRVLTRKMVGRGMTGQEDGHLHLGGYCHMLVMALGWTVPEK